MGFAPHEFLHCQIRRDPRPATARPAGGVVHAHFQAKPLGLHHGVLEHFTPLLAAETDRTGRDVLGDIHEQWASDSHSFHGFEIGGDSFTGDISIEPEPIYPGTGRVRWLAEMMLQVLSALSHY